MPRLAIVITANGSIESLESTLVSVLENRPADCEVVVALSGPYADPYELAGEVRFVAAEQGSSLQSTIRALSSVKAPFVHLLSSGCRVSEGWADRALQRFGDKQVAAVVPLVVRADDEATIFAAGIGYRPGGVRYRVAQDARELDNEALSRIVGPGSFAAFYRKAAVDSVGGLCARLNAVTADADLAMSLAAAGYTIVVEPQARLIAGAEVDGHERGFSQGLCAERLFWRHLAATHRWSTIAAHAAVVGWEFLSGLPRPYVLGRLAGRAMGCVMPSRRKFEQAPNGPTPRAKGGWRIDRAHLGSTRGEPSQVVSTR